MANIFGNFGVKTKYGAVPLLIFGSLYVGFSLMNHFLKKSKERHIDKRSVSLSILNGGDLALQRLIDYQEGRVNSQSLDIAECELKVMLQSDLPDYRSLQRIVGRMEMKGNEREAVAILKKALAKALKEGKKHEAYEIEMLLVEAFIYLGHFKEALNCGCLSDSHEVTTDPRRPMYKGILHIMLEDPREESKKCWEEFVEEGRTIQCPPDFQETVEAYTGFHHTLFTNFNEFEKFVKKLKHDIIKANQKKASNPKKLNK